MTIKQRYRRSGFLVDTHGELPDYLPLILEYAARVDPVDGAALLQEFRRSLELLRLALVERHTPYAGVITAVCATLPGASPRDRQAVMAMAAAGPPTETVGLESGRPAAAAAPSARSEDGECLMDVLLWGVLPYLMLAILVGGTIWRYRYDQFGWTTRSSQLYESRLLRIGSPLFHFGILVVIVGHIGGLVIPKCWTDAVGVSEEPLPPRRSVLGHHRRASPPWPAWSS